MIVSRQLARFASPRASCRHLYSPALFIKRPRPPRPIPVSHSPRKPFPLNPFADHHPLTPVVSILYKNHRGEGATFSRTPRPYSAQFWCTVNPLDATLLSPLLCVANKELAQYLSPLNATLTKNMGGWGSCGTAILGCALPWITGHGTRPLPV